MKLEVLSKKISSLHFTLKLLFTNNFGKFFEILKLITTLSHILQTSMTVIVTKWKSKILTFHLILFLYISANLFNYCFKDLWKGDIALIIKLLAKCSKRNFWNIQLKKYAWNSYNIEIIVFTNNIYSFHILILKLLYA